MRKNISISCVIDLEFCCGKILCLPVPHIPTIVKGLWKSAVRKWTIKLNAFEIMRALGCSAGTTKIMKYFTRKVSVITGIFLIREISNMVCG